MNLLSNKNIIRICLGLFIIVLVIFICVRSRGFQFSNPHMLIEGYGDGDDGDDGDDDDGGDGSSGDGSSGDGSSGDGGFGGFGGSSSSSGGGNYSDIKHKLSQTLTKITGSIKKTWDGKGSANDKVNKTLKMGVELSSAMALLHLANQN